MCKNQKHIGIRIFFLAIFISYFADITFFTHTHLIHGVTIVHSHYFFDHSTSKSDKKPVRHDHPEQALTLISQANSWLAVVEPSLEAAVAPQTFVLIHYSDKSLSRGQSVETNSYLRGPPMVA